MCACVHFVLQNGRSLMWLACFHGQTNTVTVLLESGTDVNLQIVSTASPAVMNHAVSLKVFLHYVLPSVPVVHSLSTYMYVVQFELIYSYHYSFILGCCHASFNLNV